MRSRKGKLVPVPEVIVSGAGLRIMNFLVGRPPQTINDLVRASRVTRTAVKEQLNDLESAGLAECTTERLAGRGRPRRRYGATRAALALLFASNQRLVVPAIWQALEDVGGRELNKKVLRRTSRILADYYNARISATEPRQRLQQFVDLLRPTADCWSFTAKAGVWPSTSGLARSSPCSTTRATSAVSIWT